ncbi:MULTISPECIES: YggS family pyridoxal phosphate-dependent enzyme [Eikenella]|uniref:Pyridoxal phosphate homeostasis protein n=1 Tax=Eikenella exigua TaxID=2528037 RepID=A0AAE6IQ40_9NEIS|nr:MULTISPECIES: YggS family pyridoxal phosphate-dependent enzyme [Eikenella]OAM26238.1 YggS family pyridoxal phosphate enzyme [Eikenella sp. NML01-A-086]OAM41907.1 YggS family pyridoxal phosphate enzyme [Eikenella sp. NML97-A-109]QED92880.1 YggS family pyridoxal phosphate-dependent enzyme [Eikenella exigua]
MLTEPHYAKAETIEELAANFAEIENRIRAACCRAGRPEESVRLLPVTKTVDERRLRMAYGLGYRHFGENKVQEAWGKAGMMADLPIEWSVIGHLQTNKIKYVARFATEFQALDSLRVAEQLNNRLMQEGRELDVLVQVNTSGEESKYGLAPQEVVPFVRQLVPFNQLKIKGLMTLALLSSERSKVRDCFVLLRTLRDKLRRNLPAGMSMDELSMGMSGDFEIAIEEGATIVRVGQAIFGARALPDSHYWPEGERPD